MEHEGWAVARLRLTAQPPSSSSTGSIPRAKAAGPTGWQLSALPARLAAIDAGAKIATEDAQAAMRLVRARAAEWRIDPQRIGFMGFSAGAITTMGLAYADDPATRPAFIAPIYGGLGAPAKPVPKSPPPMWAAMAADDPLFGKTDFALIPAWEARGGAVDYVIYEHGHGFGYQPPGTSTLNGADFSPG